MRRYLAYNLLCLLLAYLSVLSASAFPLSRQAKGNQAKTLAGNWELTYEDDQKRTVGFYIKSKTLSGVYIPSDGEQKPLEDIEYKDERLVFYVPSLSLKFDLRRVGDSFKGHMIEGNPNQKTFARAVQMVRKK